MASSRGAPFELVGRGSLLGQAALVASAALGERVAAQPPSQSTWVSSAWRCGPEVFWDGVQNVHSEGDTLYQPPVTCGLRMAERVV